MKTKFHLVVEPLFISPQDKQAMVDYPATSGVTLPHQSAPTENLTRR